MAKNTRTRVPERNPDIRSIFQLHFYTVKKKKKEAGDEGLSLSAFLQAAVWMEKGGGGYLQEEGVGVGVALSIAGCLRRSS